jgi:iodothyronine deiodinase-like protein
MKSNVKEDVCYAQPKTIEQRIAIGNDFTKKYKYNVPFGIDEMSNAANDAYAAWPERLYIVDESGRIAYKGGNGPFNYDPKEVRAWLSARYGEVKHPEAKPDEKSKDAKPADTKPDDTKPDDKSKDAKPAETKPSETKDTTPAKS